MPASTNPGEALAPVAHYELRFEYLDRIGRAVAFPCDQRGVVNVGALSPTLVENYGRACTLVGRDLAFPAVVHLDAASAARRHGH
ncbi:MAG: hypothetical protein ABW005_14880 [Burkholderiaceae bacterium]